PDRVAEWLEGHLLGLDLQQLVAELQVMKDAGATPETGALTEVLGDKMPDVLQSGLRPLAKNQLSRLLAEPSLLLELQTLVLEQGGAYWQSRPPSDEIATNTQKAWTKVQAAIAQGTVGPEGSPGPERPTRPPGRRGWLGAGAEWLAAKAISVIFTPKGDA